MKWDCTTPIATDSLEEVERELGVTYHPDAESMVPVCDVVTINAPLHPETEHLFDDALIAKMKRGAYIGRARGSGRAARPHGAPTRPPPRSRPLAQRAPGAAARRRGLSGGELSA